MASLPSISVGSFQAPSHPIDLGVGADDQADAPMAQADEIRGNGIGRLEIVESDMAQVGIIQLVPDHDARHAVVNQPFDQRLLALDEAG
jgi:hypothetical protein